MSDFIGSACAAIRGIRRTLARLLERRGHVVSAAGTLADARSLATSAKFDLLLSDLGLPDGDGCDLMRELAADSGTPGIALSGYGMDAGLERSRAAGFSAAELRAVKAAGYDDAQVIEIVQHVALNTWTNYINEVAKTDVDFPVISPRKAA